MRLKAGQVFFSVFLKAFVVAGALALLTGCFRLTANHPQYYTVDFLYKRGKTRYIEIIKVKGGFCSLGKNRAGKRVYASSCYSPKYRAHIYKTEHEILAKARSIAQSKCPSREAFRIEALDGDASPLLECRPPNCHPTERNTKPRGGSVWPLLAFECSPPKNPIPEPRSFEPDAEMLEAELPQSPQKATATKGAAEPEETAPPQPATPPEDLSEFEDIEPEPTKPAKASKRRPTPPVKKGP